MTWRIRSVRKRILLLALVPLLSLFGLYVVTTSITARNAINLARADTLKNATGQPTGTFEGEIQAERLLAVLYLAAPTPENQAKPSTRSSRQTNHQAAALRTGPDVRRHDEQRVGAAGAGHRHAAGGRQEPAGPAGAGRRTDHQPACRARRVQHARHRRQPGAESDHPPGNQPRARQPGAGVRADRPGGRPAGAAKTPSSSATSTTGSFPLRTGGSVCPARRLPAGTWSRATLPDLDPLTACYYTRDVNTQASAGLTALENTVINDTRLDGTCPRCRRSPGSRRSARSPPVSRRRATSRPTQSPTTRPATSPGPRTCS